MSGSDFFPDKSVSESANYVAFNPKISSRQSLKAKFDRESQLEKKSEKNSCLQSRIGNGWSDAFSLSMPNASAKQAWRNGTEKLSQTLNNVRTTFGTLSQKIRKSTKRRQPLVNMESPKTPTTPYTTSKALLGRTPIKLYSPFRIDTPTGKENFIRTDARKISMKGIKKLNIKPLNKSKSDIHFNKSETVSSAEKRLANDMLQTQIGIYEFQSVANRIIQNGYKD